MSEAHGIRLGFDAVATDILSGSTILENLRGYICQFVILTPAQAVICAVYVLHTHVTDACDFTPYINVNSAVMRSGKTRLLEVFEQFVAKPWLTSRVSPAVLVRKVAKQRPTLLLDESDTAFSAEKEYSEVLRGILNSGFQRGGCASVCVKKNGDWEPQDFPTFGAKVIAGIGVNKLPATVKDRSIPISLKRKMGSETTDRFRKKKEKRATQPLRDRIETWASTNIEALREAADPPVLDVLNDRQQDVCDPLLQIAYLVGGDWPARLEQALKEVCGAADSADESLSIKLLSDIRDLFDEAKVDRLASADVISKLGEIETSPWADWHCGKGLTPNSLAKLLKDFKIGPKKIREGETTLRGYLRESFTDVWGRYLPKNAPLTHISDLQVEQVEQVEQDSVYAAETLFSQPEQNDSVPLRKSEESPVFMRVVPDVPGLKLGKEKKHIEVEI
jgi:Protein of unknown function (DUF3631)